MSGVSGPVILGVRMAVGKDWHAQIMENLGNTPAAEDIVYMEGRRSGRTGLTLWFSGPRQAGSFVAVQSYDLDGVGSIPAMPRRRLPALLIISINKNVCLSGTSALANILSGISG